MNNIIFATGNQHKVDEVNLMLRDLPYNILSIKDCGIAVDVEETGLSFGENAWIKADYVRQLIGKDCFAEDSGLEVEKLDNEPGIYSARYAGLDRNHANNMSKVLKKLGQTKERSARFKSVIALIHQGKRLTFEGIVEGRIANKKMGTSGFGYDPIFIPENYTYSFGQLPQVMKGYISHRAKSIQQLVDYFSSIK